METRTNVHEALCGKIKDRNSSPAHMRPLLPKATSLISPDFGYTGIIKYMYICITNCFPKERPSKVTIFLFRRGGLTGVKKSAGPRSRTDNLWVRT